MSHEGLVTFRSADWRSHWSHLTLTFWSWHHYVMCLVVWVVTLSSRGRRWCWQHWHHRVQQVLNMISYSTAAIRPCRAIVRPNDSPEMADHSGHHFIWSKCESIQMQERKWGIWQTIIMFYHCSVVLGFLYWPCIQAVSECQTCSKYPHCKLHDIQCLLRRGHFISVLCYFISSVRNLKQDRNYYFSKDVKWLNKSRFSIIPMKVLSFIRL